MFVPVEQLVGKNIGQYKLTELIGKSDLSAVYEAAPSGPAGGAVMLTVFHLPDDCVGEAWELFMERFEDEMTRLKVLQHPHVIPYYGFGEEFGYPYLITPLTANKTLSDLLKQEGCTPTQTLQLLRQVASGLDYIHSTGIVHGSLKPSNVLLLDEQSGSRVLIANTGLTQILEMRGIGQVSHSHPHLFSVAGTLLTNPAYLAPEVVQGAPSDARADMYALGILIYEMLCGQPPFVGSDPLEVALQHVNQRIPSVQDVRPELPLALDIALQGVLERDPDRRTQSAEKLVNSLERIFIILQEAGNVRPVPLASRTRPPEAGNGRDGKQLAGLWQGMPGVTRSRMPSLVPEFAQGNAGSAQRGLHSQFKVPSSGALPPQPPVKPAASLLKLPPAQQQGQMFKSPVAPVEPLKPVLSLPATQAAPGGQNFQTIQAAQAFPMQQVAPPTSTVMITAVATSPEGTQMPATAQSAVMAGDATVGALPVPNVYGAQEYAGQPYSAVQGPQAQVAPAGSTGWAQPGNMYMPAAGMDMQAGAMYNDPRYAQQYYTDAYGQGYWPQQDQPPAPDQGRRRAVAIIAGAAVAAVVGAGGISVLRMLQARSTQDNAGVGGANNTQTLTAAGQQGGQTSSTPASRKIQTIIARQKSLAPNSAQDFTNPVDQHLAILVHLPNSNFVAYDKACTHQSVPVEYDPKTNRLVCPLHKSAFDPAKNGAVVQGPAFLPLPKVAIHINADGTITAGE
ncbi:MAG: hypothetical protein PVS3B1_35760 [Ktedonobacteraceae bacterium]